MTTPGSNASDDLPLAGLNVVDFSRLLPGPWVTQTLGDMGADVIKVEQPGVGDYGRFNPPNYRTMGVYFNSVNRNKRSITIDLARDAGKNVARRLIERADIVVESYRPGVTTKLGINYETVCSYNPGLIYCSITGFGQHGALANLPAHDMAIQAMSGVMGTRLDRQPVPPMPCFQAADYAPAGYAVTGLLGAIIARQKNGQGRHLDIAMFDSMFAWSNISLAGAISRHAGFEGRPELEVWGDNPRYDTYATADGKAVGVCLLETRTWQVFCDRIGRPDLYGEDETHADRHTDHGEREALYREAITGLCASMDRDTLTREMMSAGVPICPIYSPDEAVNSPYAHERGLLESVDHPTEGTIAQPASPLSASGLADTQRQFAPALGANTSEVLAELGYSEREREKLIHAIGATPD